MVGKLQDDLCYPPRGLRAERAAAYLGMSRSTFLEMVAEGKMPKPKRHRGMAIWDRLQLDAAFDELDDDARADRPPQNTVHQLLGIKSRDDD